MIPVLTKLPEARLKLHVHEEVLSASHPRHDSRLLALVEQPPERVDLLVHTPLDDRELWSDLINADLAVLPYRSGTHSGWLEMCHDLGTAVLAPALGHFAEQRPLHSWDPTMPGGAARAVQEAYRRHQDGWRPARPPVTVRQAEQLAVVDLHDGLYLQVGRRRPQPAGQLVMADS